jgi:predicted ArsR family transcriptional regulator
MDKRERALEYGKALDAWRELPVHQQQKIAPLLTKGAWTHLEILELLEDGSSYYQIADAVGLHINTVKQIVYGLQDSGCVVYTTKQQVKQTGRPRSYKRRIG